MGPAIGTGAAKKFSGQDLPLDPRFFLHIQFAPDQDCVFLAAFAAFDLFYNFTIHGFFLSICIHLMPAIPANLMYPTQGVGKLLRIEDQSIGNQKIKMMVIDFERNHMTLRVPVDRVELSGLRPLSSAKKLDEAIAVAKGKAGAKRMIWARRAAQYEENINSGDPMKLAEVVRDLQRRSASDTMTFSARQLYLRALERMAQEFAVLHKMDLDAASEKIEDILGVPKEIDLNAVDEEDEIETDESDEE